MSSLFISNGSVTLSLLSLFHFKSVLSSVRMIFLGCSMNVGEADICVMF